MILIGFLLFIVAVVFLVVSIVQLIKRDKLKSRRNAIISVVGAILSIIIIISSSGAETPTETATADAKEETTDTTTETKAAEETKEPTDEEWQASFKQIALNEAQSYIELTVRGTMTPESHESRTKVLLSQAEKITGPDKESFQQLAAAVQSDDLAASKELFTKLGGEDFPELTKEAAKKETVKKEPAATSIPREHKAALQSAQSYAEMMHMSKQGIYDQLTSEYGENFPKESAQYAIDNLEFDWKENALKTAQNYAESMNMSDSAIYDQLTSDYGEKFTKEEAQYAIDNLE
ncbi:Ltp family lipoprotein [Paenibacillus taichungensis]|uniref:Ltp family lipoprotein n=1 Tax=Paenibacillus taichungensis TaxID=484184 RepID=UPI002DB92095|nr:Ltp family lipoprotein [Paenibacillus taichungensis]MEC0107286.1 Ltp family lipoprotein [Paenibacillus taichungensis]MEC0194782.1 Ltp family lipoprotein [Paenibacillus taichungensis]